MKPPAKESPAPVGSLTSSSGSAGAMKMPSCETKMTPCSPFLMMSAVGPVRHDRAGRREQAVGLGVLAGLPSLMQHDVDAAHRLGQLARFASRSRGSSSPAPRSFGLCDLLQDRQLEAWVDVRQEDERRRGSCSGRFGMEVREHAELRLQGVAAVHIVVVLARPEERTRRRPLQAAQVDALAAQQVDVLLGKSSPITATMPTSVYRLAASAKYGRRAAEHSLGLAERRLQRVEASEPTTTRFMSAQSIYYAQLPSAPWRRCRRASRGMRGISRSSRSRTPRVVLD